MSLRNRPIFTKRDWPSFKAAITWNDQIDQDPLLADSGYYDIIAGTNATGTGAVSPTGATAGTGAVSPTGATAGNGFAGEADVLGAPAQTSAEKFAAAYGIDPVRVQAALTPQMSYAEYLKRTGMAGVSQKQYDATVRSAEADYAKGKATYGQKAETLGQRGLTGSGYGDYLTGASFAAMQNAKVAAADTKALTDAEMARGYGEYLTGVQQANAQAAAQAANANAVAEAEAKAQNDAAYNSAVSGVKSLINENVANDVSDDQIKALVKQQYGDIFDGDLDSWLGSAHTAIDPEIAKANEEKTAADTAQNQRNANNDFAALVGGENPLTGEAARIQMRNNGYTEEEINNAISHYSSIVKAETSANILNATELSSVPTNLQIDAIVNNGWLSEEDAATLKADAMNKRKELLVNKFENEVNTPEEETAFFAQIDEMRANGEISTKTYKGLYKQRLEANLETLLSSGEEPLVALADLNKFISSISDNVSGGLAAYLRGELADEFDVKLRTAGLQTEKGDNGELILMPVMDITIGEKTERIDFVWNALPLGPEERSALGVGKKNELKSYGENLYFHDGTSWKKVVLPSNWVYGNTNIGGKDRAKALYNLLVDKYR